MINIKTLLSIARETAEKSEYKQRMGAVIFRKNSIISAGYNKRSSWNRKLHPKFKRWPSSIHAEASAILNARTDLRGCGLVVCRLFKNGEFALAKPCSHCLTYIDYVGIKKVYYTTSDGEYKTIKL